MSRAGESRGRAVDYLSCTERISDFAKRPDLQAKDRGIWLTGRMWPRAKQEFAALGWTIQKNESRQAGK
jgi:hypothetical protein